MSECQSEKSDSLTVGPKCQKPSSKASRGVSVGTFNKWQGENDMEHQTMACMSCTACRRLATLSLLKCYVQCVHNLNKRFKVARTTHLHGL